ncbi:hypothetical protein [Hespellia stercorisuis]|uniref:Uncharacterized protein n=1 Tax=Hespellia stercorisuis DSM 15480 TaxID=1121950 RepID=A0A1M6UMH0_9FIRM|nr:hypothetical protein [Hespellia stercorisuis]SHK70328.1 hypothetical protein SAMN02745243_03545 [Hespellia stercorisuis DSM 15480]
MNEERMIHLYKLDDRKIFYICIDAKIEPFDFSGRIYQAGTGIRRDFANKEELACEIRGFLSAGPMPSEEWKNNQDKKIVKRPVKLCILKIIREQFGELYGEIKGTKSVGTSLFRNQKEMLSVLTLALEEIYQSVQKTKSN